jgi:hypothetical protein
MNPERETPLGQRHGVTGNWSVPLATGAVIILLIDAAVVSVIRPARSTC